MLSIDIKTPLDIQIQLAQRFRELRVLRNLKRSTLAVMSGVPAPSIKRFEQNGEISLRSLVRLAHAIDALQQFELVFAMPEATSLDEIRMRELSARGPRKKRGRK